MTLIFYYNACISIIINIFPYIIRVQNLIVMSHFTKYKYGYAYRQLTSATCTWSQMNRQIIA